MNLQDDETCWIWTARYANPRIVESGLIPVRTTPGAPRFPLPYPLDVNVQLIAPPKDAFGVTNRAFFRRLYFQKLDGIGVDAILARLKQVRDDRPAAKGLVLLCFEDLRNNPNFCHRTMFAEWLLARAGVPVLELPETVGQLTGLQLNLELQASQLPS